jgi:hypothetical protein
MRTQKVCISVGLGFVLLAVGFLALRSDTPTEPITIYKAVEPLAKSTVNPPVGETQGGHFHADGTFHAQPHKKVKSNYATKPETPSPNSVSEAKAAEINRLKAKLAKLETEKAERLAIEAEVEELITWSEGFQDRFFAYAAEILPLKDLTDEEFLEKFPTTEDRIKSALELLKFEEYREEVVKRFEGASPQVRQLIHQELENIGYLDEYKRIFLQPSAIPEYVEEFIQANLDEEAKVRRNFQ